MNTLKQALTATNTLILDGTFPDKMSRADIFYHTVYLDKCINNFTEFFMPRKNNKQQKNNNFGNLEFVSIRLSSEEKKAFILWEKENARLLEDNLTTLIENSIKLSVSYDMRNDTFIATFTCKDDASPNRDFGLTSRGKTWYHAINLNIFKHWELADNEIWSSLQDANADDDWG